MQNLGLTFAESNSTQPSTAVSESTIHAVWQNWTATYYGIHYTRSLDCGLIWEQEKKLPLPEGSEMPTGPRIAAEGDNIHVVYYDIVSSLELKWNIFYIRSIDRGDTWSNPILISAVDGWRDKWPEIAAEGNSVHIAWAHEYTMGQYQMAYRNSTDNGNTWNLYK